MMAPSGVLSALPRSPENRTNVLLLVWARFRCAVNPDGS